MNKRDHGRVRAGRILPRPEDVEVPQGHGFQLERRREGVAVVFRGQLGRRVRRQRIDKIRLALATQRLIAIGGCRGREDHPPHAQPPGGIQHMHRARAASGVAVQRAVDAPLDRGQGGLVKDAIDSRDRPVHRGGVDDIALDQFDPVAEGGQVRQIAGAEVIEHADAVAALDEGLRDMRTDKSGPAGYEESSHSL